jgi:hypothetical protein
LLPELLHEEGFRAPFAPMAVRRSLRALLILA